MTTTHTPGPWHTVFGPDGIELRYFDGQMMKIVGDDKEFTLTSCRANARLIAAAPELLEACKLAIKILDYLEKSRIPGYSTIKDAISKAEGNT